MQHKYACQGQFEKKWIRIWIGLHTVAVSLWVELNQTAMQSKETSKVFSKKVVWVEQNGQLVSHPQAPKTSSGG